MESQTCPSEFPAPSILGEKATPFWAQEYSGADLIKEELRELVEQYNLEKQNLAIFDLGFEKDHVMLTEEILIPPQMNGNRTMRANHGTAVANLLYGPENYGTVDYLNLIMLGPSFYIYNFRKFEQNNRFPKVISNSVGWRDNEKVSELSQEASERGILWFLAAGNKYPNPVSQVEKNSKAILVGSFAPSGLQSFNTQVDDKIVVLAPANNELASIDGNGNHHLFGETSGATPLVAGTLLNISTLLPSLKRDEAITLIKKSSFKSIENLLGDSEKPGLLNGYKAFLVAKKVFLKCRSNEECIKEELAKGENYLFSSSEVMKCESVINKSCSEKKDLIKEMRKRVFLGNAEQAKELACVYLNQGYEKNAEYFNLIASQTVDLDKMEEKAIEAIKQGILTISYYKYLNHYSDKVIQVLNSESGLREFHTNRLKELASD